LIDVNLEENFFNINFTKGTITSTDNKSGTLSTQKSVSKALAN